MYQFRQKLRLKRLTYVKYLTDVNYENIEHLNFIISEDVVGRVNIFYVNLVR